MLSLAAKARHAFLYAAESTRPFARVLEQGFACYMVGPLGVKSTTAPQTLAAAQPGFGSSVDLTGWVAA